MFTLAHLAIPTLAPEDVDSRMLTQMMRILDSVSLELTRGQHLDLAFEQQSNVTKEKYLDMVDGKTAALISGAAEMGALAGGSTALEHFRAFGHSLGMAFQILDDMLDIWGDPELTGKQRAVDIYQRKKSLPVLYGVEKSKELRAIYQKTDPFDDHDVGNVVNLLSEVGARDYATKLAGEYTTSTIESLEAALPNETDREQLLTFANTLLQRDH
jgi:geranylgeranyl diphosphate synthase type I